MKYRPAFALSVAALSLAVLAPNSTQLAFAQTPAVAMRMVPARAALDRTLVANKLKAGDEFRAVLAKKIHLDNGPELPTGTILIGQIATDDMNQAGTSKLALRFTEAKLKNGQTVPIKATIVGIAAPVNETADNIPVDAGDQVSNSWNDGTLIVDQVDALNGVDLHSRIASANSGVFVSTKKDNMKLEHGSEFLLAIAQLPHTAQVSGNQ